MKTLYPTTFDANRRHRLAVFKAAEGNKKYQDHVYEQCRRDLLYWVNTFCWTKDPRVTPSVMPWVSYDAYQDDYMLKIESAIDNQYDELTDKSRDMGVSWMVLYVFSWMFLFEPGSDFRVGSRKEDFVDKLGDMDTLLEKVRFNLKQQPKWLLPVGFDVEKHAGWMKILNPENGNSIIGESANPSFGSGGRRKAILLDEFSKWDNRVAESAWTSTADVTNCRLPVSTPLGSANKFAVLAAGTQEKIKKISLHWTLHPKKAAGAYYLDGIGTKIPIKDLSTAFKLWRQSINVRSPWYDAEAERRTPSDLAQEVDINYLMSGFPYFDLQAVSKQKVWGYLENHVPGTPIPAGKHIRGVLLEIQGKVLFRETPDGWLRLYEKPNPIMQYVVSGDVAEGLPKGDESFGIVRDKYQGNVWATFHGLYDTDDFEDYVVRAAKYFRQGIGAVENNNHGHGVNKNLLRRDIEIYFTKRTHVDGKTTIVKPGWSTDKLSRPTMLNKLALEVSKFQVQVRDETILAQMKTFVRNEKTGKPEADGSFHDDGVMAMAIGSAVIEEMPYEPPKSKAVKTRDDSRLKQKNGGFGFGK